MVPGGPKSPEIYIKNKIISKSNGRIIGKNQKDYAENATNIITQHLARIFLATNKRKIDAAIDKLKKDM